jgi:class 3 adenylate cyclase
MRDIASSSDRVVRRLVIVFVDLTTYARDAEGCEDARVADVLDRLYEAFGAAASRAGGVVVKTIGDGALLVFEAARADDAVAALLGLRDEVAALCGAAGWGSQLIVKMHVGDVVCGPFGPRDAKRFDVIGSDVNVTARLQTKAFALSAEAFRALSKEGRARFKKHTPPITYLPVEDRRPARFAKG